MIHTHRFSSLVFALASNRFERRVPCSALRLCSMFAFLNCLKHLSPFTTSSSATRFPEPDHLSEAELRQALKAAGETWDTLAAEEAGGRQALESRYRTLVAHRMASTNPGTRTLRTEDCKLGPFNCRVLNNYGATAVSKHKDSRLPVGLVPDVAVVALHGFGAGADQFESVFESVLGTNAGLAKKRLLIVCPQANEHAGSPAWFPLDIMSWMMLFSQVRTVVCIHAQ
jgi:hypothetical protein